MEPFQKRSRLATKRQRDCDTIERRYDDHNNPSFFTFDWQWNEPRDPWDFALRTRTGTPGDGSISAKPSRGKISQTKNVHDHTSCSI